MKSESGRMKGDSNGKDEKMRTENGIKSWSPRIGARRPGGFVADLPERATLDEVQRAPELFAALKVAVDRPRVPGRFILTGSANVLFVPRLSDSLAGRMEILRLRSASWRGDPRVFLTPCSRGRSRPEPSSG